MERYKGQRLGRNRSVEATNASEQTTVKNATDADAHQARGRWRPAVRGLRASNRRSASRLNAIAAERAVAMQSRMPTQS